ncbi:alpha/beta hydrolase [Pseudalkalibacillus hwajinpoensis]|uniref:alpha/beta hydrolase n=1 Tax=Guptibacillus hwajinpoensis TaxID=208199 RepID=UPI00325B19B1
MCIRKRAYQLDGEWTIVLVPERPNGFGIFIIGGLVHFVDSESSFWLQNHTRSRMIEEFLEAGYTIYTSNLYGRHWGSPKAVKLTERIYNLVHKQEILNPKVHILAEGMGVLAANAFLKNKYSQVRSAALLNPCFDVKNLVHHEQEHRLFYKRLIRELAIAYEVERENVLKEIEDCRIEVTSAPIKVWHHNKSPYSLEQIRQFERVQEEYGFPIDLALLSDSYHSLGQKMIRFFQLHEGRL